MPTYICSLQKIQFAIDKKKFKIKCSSTRGCHLICFYHIKVTFNKEIWLIGGLTNKEPTEKTYKLNTAANPAKWEPQATLKTPRANHGCATYVTGDKEVIVVAGGFGKSSKRASNLVALDTVEFLTDPAAITFTESKKAIFLFVDS